MALNPDECEKPQVEVGTRRGVRSSISVRPAVLREFRQYVLEKYGGRLAGVLGMEAESALLDRARGRGQNEDADSKT